MKNHRLALFAVIGLAALLAACGGQAPAATAGATAEPTSPVRVTLPPAWTATPSATFVPPTPTASATPHPAAVSARLTATAWPTLHIVAVGAGADTADWQSLDFPSGSLLAPPDFEVTEPRLFDAQILVSMQALGGALAGMVDMPPTPIPGGPTATPFPLEALTSAYDMDFMEARDRRSRTTIFIVSSDIPDGVDLETLMTTSAGVLSGEVDVRTRETVGGASRPTGRTIVQIIDRRRGTIENRAIYIVLDGGRAWIVTFAMPDFDAFQAALPTFEASALSLEPAD
jgi:hypothetical protein